MPRDALLVRAHAYNTFHSLPVVLLHLPCAALPHLVGRGHHLQPLLVEGLELEVTDAHRPLLICSKDSTSMLSNASGHLLYHPATANQHAKSGRQEGRATHCCDLLLGHKLLPLSALSTALPASQASLPTCVHDDVQARVRHLLHLLVLVLEQVNQVEHNLRTSAQGCRADVKQ